MIRLTKIFTYPLKGARASEVSNATLSAGGLIGDRQFAVVVRRDETEVLVGISRREVPSLALIRAELEGDRLVLSHPQHTSLRVSFDEGAGAEIKVACFRHLYIGRDMGEEVGSWLRSVLGTYKGETLRLAKFLRHAQVTYANYTANAVPSGFYDRHPLTVVSATSLEALNKELEKNGSSAVQVERFSPTLVFDGIEPFGEHRLGGLTSGAICLRFDEPVVRCGYVAIDPTTSVRDGANELIRALKSLNIAGDNHASFGICASIISPTTNTRLQVGQEFDLRLN